MNTQQHLNQLFGNKIPPQVMQELDALRSLWFQLKGSPREPGSLASEWVGYSISVVAGTPWFRFFFTRQVPHLTLLNQIIERFAAFSFKHTNVFGVKFSALTPRNAERGKPGKRVMAHVETKDPKGKETVQAGMSLTVSTASGGGVAGSVGAFLTDKNSNIWILSANHVLAANGSGIFAPDSIQFDGGRLFPTKTVRFTPLLLSVANVADVAIAQVAGGSKLWADPAFLNNASTVTPATFPPGGAVTRKGEGKLAHPDTKGIEVTLAPDLEYNPGHCGVPGGALMENQYLVEGLPGVQFSQNGDSGSLALYQNFVMGMVIASSETICEIAYNYTVVTPFAEVLNSLNTNLDGGGSSLGFSLYQGRPILIP